MTKRLAILLVALFALGFGVAACGDDDDDDSGDSANTAAQTETTAGGGDPDAADEPGNQGGAPSASVKQAVDSCKQSIAAQPQLSADVKKDLNEVCEEAASGDEDGARKAAREVCRKIVEETAPAGAAREQALQACDQSTAAP